MIIKNYTPHLVCAVATDGSRVEFPSWGAARLDSDLIYDAVYGGITIWHRGPSHIVDLPDPKEDTLLIVSSVVKMALPSRPDLIVPSCLVRRSKVCRGFWR